MNLNEKVWLWRDELHDALPGTRLPCYATRSVDNGRSWQEPVLLHEEWTGELRGPGSEEVASWASRPRAWATT